MGKFLLGFIVGGVSVGLLVAWWLQRSTPAEVTLAQTPESADQELNPSTQQLSSTRPMDAPTGNPEPALFAAKGGDAFDDDVPISEGENATPDPSQPAQQSLRPTNPKPASYRPIPVTEHHAKLLQGNTREPGIGWQHEQLEFEEEDVSWAYEMELRIREFLNAHPSAALFQVPSIECRTTRCQIQALGYDSAAVGHWGLMMDQMREQPWFNFFGTGSSSSNIDGGGHAIVTFLEREAPQL